MYSTDYATHYSIDEIVRTAQEIRPYLMKLLEAPNAQRVDQQLAQLLSQSSDPLGMASAIAPQPTATQQAITQQIVDVLSQQESTREWLRLALEERYPAETILRTLWTYHPLSSREHSIESPRYRCPVASCHQEWHRRSPEASIPKCPIHHLQMVRDSKAHD